MNTVKCCILGCSNKDILSLCRRCKIYFCFNHSKLIDSHSITPSFSIYDNFVCCDYCCNRHFYVKCSNCEEMVRNTIADIKNGTIICKYPCFKYQNNI